MAAEVGLKAQKLLAQGKLQVAQVKPGDTLPIDNIGWNGVRIPADRDRACPECK